MKIMFYKNTLRRGGAERVFSALANMFSKAGHEVVFVTSNRYDDEYKLLNSVNRISIEKSAIDNSFWNRNIKRTIRLRKIVKKYKPDIMVSASPEANFRAIIATIGKKTLAVPSVISDAKREYSNKVYALLAKVLYSFASGLICQTAEEKNWFPKRIRKKSVVLYNQVDEAFYHQVPPVERKDIICVGRLIPLKRQYDIISAFAKIEDIIEDNLIIVGEGPSREELEQLVAQYRIQSRVVFAGLSDNVAKLVNNCKIFVHASSVEGLPNALMEALALGVPCIAADCSGGGVRELLGENEFGIVFPVGDVDLLSENMKNVASDANIRNELAQKAKDRGQGFQSDIIFKQWEHYFLKLRKYYAN